MAISGTAAWLMAGSALAGTGYAVYAGERGAKMQRQAVRRQTAAQQSAEARALSQERRGMMEASRARAKKADVSTLLAAQETGGNPTMLTGPRGATTTSLLGE